MRDDTFQDKQPTLRVTTMPNDSNSVGTIFGGWLMSQIDLAAAHEAEYHSRGPVVTVAVKELVFHKPLYVHDNVSFYTELVKTGTTSMTIKVDVFAERLRDGEYETDKIADALVVYVAISSPGVKRQIQM